MRKLIIMLTATAMLTVLGCSSNEDNKSASASGEEATETPETENGNPSYDPTRGIGKYTKVELGDKLDAAMAESGKKVFDVKCSSCHKLTTEKLVGPGWSGVTSRRAPEWIMNFITNPDEMLDKDPVAQAQLEICLVRMPNQSLTDDDARHLLEFMRQNDGVK
jgi:mono/diheme cytochrome c family protein